jgi:hypothetical protein
MDFLTSQKAPQHLLYGELLGRLYHIERAFIARRHIKLHYSTAVRKEVASNYLKIIQTYKEFFWSVEETQLWFITIELHSRFLAGSKKGLAGLVKIVNDDDINTQLGELSKNHAEVIGFIKTQRDKYLAHADDVEWKDFPNVFDKEYDNLLVAIKDLMAAIGKRIGSSRIPTAVMPVGSETSLVMDALLGQLAPELDVESLARNFEDDLKKFLRG